MNPPPNTTVGELQELYDTAWLILKKHNATADVITYQLAMEIAKAVTVLRDRQKDIAHDPA